MTTTQEIIDQTEKYGAHNYHPLPIVVEEAEGVWVKDPEGNKYMDMLSAYSAVNQGHRHPKIISALEEQAGKVTLTSRAFHNQILGPWTKKVAELTGKDKVLPMNTGVEAVETAIKAARRWAYQVKGVEDNKAEVIAAKGNFHGRTLNVISFSTDPSSRINYGPFMEGYEIIPYNNLPALEKALQDKNIAGFLVEPIQGEAGVVVPDEGFLAKAKQYCSDANVLFIGMKFRPGLHARGKCCIVTMKM